MTTATQPTAGTPTFGRDIGVTYFATSALRDMLLADVGLTFEDSLLLTALAPNGGCASRDQLVSLLVGGIKTTPEAAATALDLLLDRALATEHDGSIAVTAAGAEALERFNARVAASAPKLYGDIPAADLAVARRVLATVTERANRELALSTTS
jgi:hypothetical protein